MAFSSFWRSVNIVILRPGLCRDVKCLCIIKIITYVLSTVHTSEDNEFVEVEHARMPITFRRKVFSLHLFELSVGQVHAKNIISGTFIVTTSTKEIHMRAYNSACASPTRYITSRDKNIRRLPITLGLLAAQKQRVEPIVSDVLFSELEQLWGRYYTKLVAFIWAFYLW